MYKIAQCMYILAAIDGIDNARIVTPTRDRAKAVARMDWIKPLGAGPRYLQTAELCPIEGGGRPDTAPAIAWRLNLGST